MHEGNSRLFHQKSWSCFCQRHSTQEGRSSEEERRNEHELKMAESLNGSVFTRSGGGSECSTLLFAEFGKVVTIDIFANTARGSTVSGWTDTTNFPSNNPVPFRFAGIIFKLVDEVEIESGSCGRVADGCVMILNCVTSFPGVAVIDAGSILPNWDILGVISNTCKEGWSPWRKVIDGFPVESRVGSVDVSLSPERRCQRKKTTIFFPHCLFRFPEADCDEFALPTEYSDDGSCVPFCEEGISSSRRGLLEYDSPSSLTGSRYLSVNYIVTRDERDLIDWLLLVHQMVELC
ncbi:hypothetical protein BLNAU_22617 [Blattamonas nauphoetae]|uniref:Uncharacterized protein n=1 Tax=Blattamonas nauphoetae TaxID=2049346 RepID=A0ABQ9WSJ4_9EUKA|nr:hypothetical protein BLNAU_22617 [Blattamonas nauphoetae]